MKFISVKRYKLNDMSYISCEDLAISGGYTLEPKMLLKTFLGGKQMDAKLKSGQILNLKGK